MFDIITQVLTYAKILITFSLFTYIYKYFYNSCSEKKVIKTKDEKPKKVIKTRIGLSLIYLILVLILYFSITWYIFLTLLIAVFAIIITLIHKFEPSTLNILKKYDSNPIIKKIWYFFSLFMNIIFKIMSPCHRVLENKINKNKEIVKNGLLNQVSKLNFNGLNMGFLGNLSTFSDNTVKTKINSNTKDMIDFNKIENFLKNNKNDKNKNKKNIKSNSKTPEQTSELNKYIIEDSKTKSIKLKNNEKQNAKIMIDNNINIFNNTDINDNFSVISDIEEPLDIILLNKKKIINDKPINYINEPETQDATMEEFLNKIKTIEHKINKNTIVTSDDDLSCFINKTGMFIQDNNNSSSEDNM